MLRDLPLSRSAAMLRDQRAGPALLRWVNKRSRRGNGAGACRLKCGNSKELGEGQA